MPTYTKRELPPCPGDPKDYQLARMYGKYYWRQRRGRSTPITLNDSLQARATAMKMMKPTLQQLRQLLCSFMQPLPPGRLHQRLFGMLQEGWVSKQQIDYGLLKGMELAPEWPLEKLLKAPYVSSLTQGSLQLKIAATKQAIVPRNNLVTEFVLETLFISGEGDGILTANETSVLYDITTGITTDCLFEYKLPEQQSWMLLLKAACFEGKEWAVNRKHYGVRVVAAGGGSEK